MSFLVASIAITLISSLLMAVMFLFMYGLFKEKCLLRWSGLFGWGLLVTILLICKQRLDGGNLFLVLAWFCTVAIILCMVSGTYQFTGRNMPRIWWICAFLLVPYISLTGALNVNKFIINFPVFAYFGLGQIFSGIVLIRFKGVMGPAKTVTGIIFVIRGTLSSTYPFLGVTSAFAPYGYMAGSVLMLFAGFGLILTYFTYSRDRLLGAQSELKRASEALEGRVRARTIDLEHANDLLRLEAAEREKVTAELRSHQKKLKQLDTELILTEERERRRIAIDLHDQIGQSLAMTRIRLKQLQTMVSGDNEKELLDKSLELVENMSRETRVLTSKLSPPILYELGLVAALEWLTEQVEEQHGLKAGFEILDEPPTLSESANITVFRSTRELLLNVVKHAQADRVEVTVRTDSGAMRVDIRDNGIGIDDVAVHKDGGRGFGLFSIKERLNELHGRLEVKSPNGRGTLFSMVIPYGINRVGVRANSRQS